MASSAEGVLISSSEMQSNDTAKRTQNFAPLELFEHPRDSSTEHSSLFPHQRNHRTPLNSPLVRYASAFLPWKLEKPQEPSDDELSPVQKYESFTESSSRLKVVVPSTTSSWNPSLSPGVGIAPVLIPHANTSKNHPTAGNNFHAVVASFSYMLSSCSMTLANKMVLSGYDWNAPVILMVYQNLIAAAAVTLLRYSGIIAREPIPVQLVKLWLPVNLIFVAMLLSSLFALQNLNVAMATILKNGTNVFTAVGEMYLLNTQHGIKVWSSLVLMIVSAFLAGQTDLQFNLIGYLWQFANCIMTATYTLTMRFAMKSARQFTNNNVPLGEFTMVLLNSVLSLPFGTFLAFFMGEFHYAVHSSSLALSSFWIAASMSGILGLAISFTSMWCLHTTSPTTYSLIGSFNKVPLSILGIVLFNVPVSLANVSSIMLGLFAGMLLAYAKVTERK